MVDKDPELNLADAARLAGVTRQRIQAAVHAGHIPRARADSPWPTVRRSAVIAWTNRPSAGRSGRPAKPKEGTDD